MTELFRVRTESPQEPEIDLQATPHREMVSDTLKGNEKKVGDPITEDEKKLDLWEGLNRTKFINDYFNIKNIVDADFSLKMQVSKIDKFIRRELEKKGYEKNIENYEAVLKEIEEEIGSSRLELFKRITKLAGYSDAVNRLNKAKELKEKYNSTLQ
jgi:hypothetical protein